MERCHVSLPEVSEAGWRRPARPGHRDRRLRIRAAGGQLTTGQLRTVGEVSRRYAHDLVTIAGQQFELPLDRAQQRPEVTARLHAAGLILAAGPEAAPAFTGSPVAGIAADEIVDGTPALREIRDPRAPRAEFRDLPRTFTTTVSGSPRLDVLHEASDVSFSGVRHPERGPGFDVRVGAGLLAHPVPAHPPHPAHPARAGRLGAFVTAAEVPAVWAAIAAAFGDFGYRRLDRRERLALLLADAEAAAAPAAGFRQLIERQYLHYSLADGPAPPPPAGPRDHMGVHPQRDGRYYVGVGPCTAGWPLTDLADLAEAHGSTRVRITPYQKLIVLDVPPGWVEPFCASLERIGLTARPALSHRRR
jgi:sulfite reductase (ferredoxin)